MLDTKNSLVNEPVDKNTQQRVPTYVGLSRAISGYSEYNKYRSTNNKLDLLKEYTFNLDNRSSPHCRMLLSHSNTSSSDQINNYTSLPYEFSTEYRNSGHDDVAQLQSSKSFLQKKIESLYGQSFADDWCKSRSKCKSPSSKSNMDTSKRSPSCPPNRSDISHYTVQTPHTNSTLEQQFSKASSKLTRFLVCSLN